MTPEQFDRLPKWAQEHIGKLTRERDTARRELDKYRDAQTPSPFYTEAFYTAAHGRFPRRYIQAHGSLVVEHGGVLLRIGLRDHGISMLFDPTNRIESDRVAILPSSANAASLVALPKAARP